VVSFNFIKTNWRGKDQTIETLRP